jgi:hypothetical protein
MRYIGKRKVGGDKEVEYSLNTMVNHRTVKKQVAYVYETTQ